MNKKLFDYDNIQIIIYDDEIKCLSFKWINYIVYNWFYNEFVINKSLFYNDSKTLFDKVKKFFKYYLWKTIKNKKDFITFINECKSFNWIYLKCYDWYNSNWFLLF